MSFELDDRGADDIDAQARSQGVPFGTGLEPGFFSGTAMSAVKGLARGAVAKSALLVGDAATPLLRGPAQAADKALGLSLESWLDEQQSKNRQALEDLKPDPITTGFAGQVVGGLFDLGSSALLYSPEGAALLEGYGRRQELIGQGVAPETATAVGVVTGASTLVGVKAPVTLGRAAAGQGIATVARNAAYGAGINAATGVAERGTSRDVLERAGYADQAAMLEPFDLKALAADAALGTLFSGGAAAFQMRASAKGQQTTDAALAVRQARHGAIGSAPGVPVDAKASASHGAALSTAMGQALRNEPVNVGDTLADATFVRPASEATTAARAELQLHVADLLPVPGAVASTPGATGPRGVRNNNPGNIEAGADRWDGQTGSDGRFATFDTPEAGIRALAKTLITYQEKHGLNTVEGIVNRWAPPKENNTGAYVRAVADAIGLEPTTPLNLRDASTLQKLAGAIIHHENGAQPYPDAVLRSGVDLGLGNKAPDRVPEGKALAELAAQPEPERLPNRAGERPAEQSPVKAEAADVERVQAAGQIATEPQQNAEAPLAAAPRTPRASELEPMAVGPGVIEPREIATGRPLYRETSPEGLGDMLMDDQRAHVRQMFVADNPDLAIGQGKNKGVQVVFREGAMSGAEHRKPGTGDLAGREYRTDLVAPRAIQTFTVPKGFNEKSLRGLARRALAEFTRQELPDGSSRYERRAGATPAEVASGQADAMPTVAPVDGVGRPQALPQPDSSVATAGAQAADPLTRAAADAVQAHPDMRVVLEDGTELSAREVLARAQAERQMAEQDAAAFDAAVNCFLRT